MLVRFKAALEKISMNNDELMMYLQLAFIDYNQYAAHHNTFAFFTKEVNDRIVLYSVPEYNEIKIPQGLPRVLRYVNHSKEDNLFSLDVIDSLTALLKRIHKVGLTEYPNPFADRPIIRKGTVLCDAVILTEETNYYRVVHSTRSQVQLVQIESHHGRPILSHVTSKPFAATIEHNAISINGRLLMRYKTRPDFFV